MDLKKINENCRHKDEYEKRNQPAVSLLLNQSADQQREKKDDREKMDDKYSENIKRGNK